MRLWLILFVALGLSGAAARAENLLTGAAGPLPPMSPDELAGSSDTPPPRLKELQTIQSADDEKQEVGFQIRVEAQKEAALSYGLRGGLAHRTYEISQRISRYEDPLSRLYDFRRLLMAAPGGVYIEPPVIGEQQDALVIANKGQSAALADNVLKITANAKLVTTARDWRTYLLRDWGKVDPPPDVLLPKNEEERVQWFKWIKQGWDAGIAQGDDIFQEDLSRLNRDFTGMVKYRKLLAQAMVTLPYAMLVDRGVTGGGIEMRIGDRAVEITGLPELQNQPRQWTPVALPSGR